MPKARQGSTWPVHSPHPSWLHFLLPTPFLSGLQPLWPLDANHSSPSGHFCWSVTIGFLPIYILIKKIEETCFSTALPTERQGRREGLEKNGLESKIRRELDEDCKGTDNVRPDLSPEVQPVSLRDTWWSLPEISVKSSWACLTWNSLKLKPLLFSQWSHHFLIFKTL